MTQQPDMSEMDAYYEQTRKPLFNTPTSAVGRAIFAVLLVLWFTLLTLPCAMIWLAFGNTITIPRGNIPESELHPRLEVQLIMEIDNRGLKFTTTDVSQSNDLNLCIENNIGYFLWENDTSAEPASYCQCYQREDAESEWEFIEQFETACTP
ncbi:MAG: hypothetical protein Phog2KO_01620 [Phototrophicaceae bacterium]